MNRSDRHKKPPHCQRKPGRHPSETTCDSGPKEIEAVYQRAERQTTPARGKDLKGTRVAPEDSGKSPKAKFRIYGEELIEKVVKANGNSGRVYLPPGWVGKHVKIVRTD